MIFKINLYINLIKVLFLSATPIVNNPSEVVDIINLLSNKQNKISKSDIFYKKELKPDALDKIKKFIDGKISFVQDRNIDFYPSKKYIGDTIPNIDELKFIKCPMTELQYNTYIELSKKPINIDFGSLTSSDKTEYSDGLGVSNSLHQNKVNLSLENRYLMDYILPTPNSETVGIYNGHDIKEQLLTASKDWLNKHNITINKKKS